jgi:hypothetical protein
MILDDDYVEDTCKPGQQEKTCRYLLMGPGGWQCGKLSDLKTYIDQRVSAGTMIARGDNCEGR